MISIKSLRTDITDLKKINLSLLAFNFTIIKDSG